MKITDIQVHKVDGAWRSWVFVEVETDVGLTGLGEASLEGREFAVEGAVVDLSRCLVGTDPRRIRHAVHEMTSHGYWTAGPVISSAVGGIEIALWDILGQSVDLPISALLGGPVRDRLRVYANGWYFGASTPDEFAERATDVAAQGYSALKFDPFGQAELALSAADLRSSIERVSAVRQAVGPGVDLMVEGHGRFGIESAIRVAHELERIDSVLFFEEPIAPGDPDGEARVARSTSVPIATGERWYSVAVALGVICRREVSVAQPDVIHIGGIGRLFDVAMACEHSNVGFAPHNASGPVATAATLQVAAVATNLTIQEMFVPWDAAWRDDVVRPGPEIVDGHVQVSQLPGLGVTLSHAEVALRPFQPRDLRLFDDESILANSHKDSPGEHTS